MAFFLIILSALALITDQTTGPMARDHVLTWIDGLDAIRQYLMQTYPRFFA